MLSLLYPTLDGEPMQLGLLKEGDWYGIGTMAVGLACLQTVLDEGNQDGWFGSPYIVHLSIIAAVMLTLFVVLELRIAKPALRLHLLATPQFWLGDLCQHNCGVRSLRLGLRVARVSRCRPGLQRGTDRIRACLVGAASTLYHSIGSSSSQTLRCAGQLSVSG